MPAGNEPAQNKYLPSQSIKDKMYILQVNVVFHGTELVKKAIVLTLVKVGRQFRQGSNLFTYTQFSFRAKPCFKTLYVEGA